MPVAGRIEVEIASNIARLTKDISSVRRQFKGLNKSAKSMKRNFSTITKSVNVFRNALIGLGAVTVIRGLIRQMGQLEQGWIGVAKTTGLAGAELNKLKKEIRALSIEMKGVPLEGLQDIAQIAGQLGIAAQDITEFTRVVAMFTTATELTAAESATAFAQLANVLNEPISKLEIMGSVINELSNNSVATARDITDLGLRIGGAGKTLELTTAELFGLSAAMRDAGIPVEEGGTAISQVFLKMLTSAEKFAKASRVSLTDFSKMIKEEPLEAVKTFLKSLTDLDKVARAKALVEIGFTGRKTAGTLLKLANAMEQVEEQIGRANAETARGTSLNIEYETAAKGLLAQATSVGNAFKVLADQAGEVLLPALKKTLPVVIDMVEAFGLMGAAVDDAIAALAGFDKRTEIDKLRDKLQSIDALLEGQFTQGGFGILNAKEFNKLTEERKKLLAAIGAQGRADGAFQLAALKREAERKRIAEALKKIKDEDRGAGAGASNADIKRFQKAQEAINAVRIATEKLGKTKRELIPLLVAEFAQIATNTEQLKEFMTALEAQVSVEESIAAKKKAIRDAEIAEKERNAAREEAIEVALAEKKIEIAENLARMRAEIKFAELGKETADLARVGEQTELERIQEDFQNRLDALQLHHAEMIAEMSKFTDDQMAIEARAAELSMDFAEATAQFKQQKLGEQFGAAANFFQNLFVLTGSKNKALFALTKAAAIAEATISGHRAAVEAFEWGMAAGGPGLAFAALAASLAATGAQIASIAATSIGGGGGGGGVSAGLGVVGGSEGVADITRDTSRPTFELTVNIQNGQGSREYWQNIIEETIAPGLIEAQERNVNLTINAE